MPALDHIQQQIAHWDNIIEQAVKAKKQLQEQQRQTVSTVSPSQKSQVLLGKLKTKFDNQLKNKS